MAFDTDCWWFELDDVVQHRRRRHDDGGGGVPSPPPLVRRHSGSILENPHVPVVDCCRGVFIALAVYVWPYAGMARNRTFGPLKLMPLI